MYKRQVKGLEKCVSNGIIVTCGTNGKTTTNNLMASALEAKGYKVICNKMCIRDRVQLKYLPKRYIQKFC